MDRLQDYELSPTSTSTPQEEPKIENDDTNHPEIEAPNPSTATPTIPAEMPSR